MKVVRHLYECDWCGKEQEEPTIVVSQLYFVYRGAATSLFADIEVPDSVKHYCSPNCFMKVIDNACVTAREEL